MDPAPSDTVGLLLSGGLDSAILLGETLAGGTAVHPLYVRSGLFWEPAELAHLRRFLDALKHPTLAPLEILDMPVSDLYGNHWSLTGRDVPDAASADEAVYLPGRNVLLLAKALLWCHLRRVPELALGVLEANPFQDATPEFFTAFQAVVNQAVDDCVSVRRPYAGRTKVEIVRRGSGMPLEHTFSCLRPTAGRHCGRCNKCAERRRAFAAAGISDPTPYLAEPSCTA